MEKSGPLGSLGSRHFLAEEAARPDPTESAESEPDLRPPELRSDLYVPNAAPKFEMAIEQGEEEPPSTFTPHSAALPSFRMTVDQSADAPEMVQTEHDANVFNHLDWNSSFRISLNDGKLTVTKLFKRDSHPAQHSITPDAAMHLTARLFKGANDLLHKPLNRYTPSEVYALQSVGASLRKIIEEQPGKTIALSNDPKSPSSLNVDQLDQMLNDIQAGLSGSTAKLPELQQLTNHIPVSSAPLSREEANLQRLFLSTLPAYRNFQKGFDEMRARTLAWQTKPPGEQGHLTIAGTRLPVHHVDDTAPFLIHNVEPINRKGEDQVNQMLNLLADGKINGNLCMSCYVSPSLASFFPDQSVGLVMAVDPAAIALTAIHDSQTPMFTKQPDLTMDFLNHSERAKGVIAYGESWYQAMQGVTKGLAGFPAFPEDLALQMAELRRYQTLRPSNPERAKSEISGLGDLTSRFVQLHDQAKLLIPSKHYGEFDVVDRNKNLLQNPQMLPLFFYHAQQLETYVSQLCYNPNISDQQLRTLASTIFGNFPSDANPREYLISKVNSLTTDLRQLFADEDQKVGHDYRYRRALNPLLHPNVLTRLTEKRVPESGPQIHNEVVARANGGMLLEGQQSMRAAALFLHREFLDQLDTWKPEKQKRLAEALAKAAQAGYPLIVERESHLRHSLL